MDHLSLSPARHDPRWEMGWMASSFMSARGPHLRARLPPAHPPSPSLRSSSLDACETHPPRPLVISSLSLPLSFSLSKRFRLIQTVWVWRRRGGVQLSPTSSFNLLTLNSSVTTNDDERAKAGSSNPAHKWTKRDKEKKTKSGSHESLLREREAHVRPKKPFSLSLFKFWWVRRSIGALATSDCVPPTDSQFSSSNVFSFFSKETLPPTPWPAR